MRTLLLGVFISCYSLYPRFRSAVLGGAVALLFPRCSRGRGLPLLSIPLTVFVFSMFVSAPNVDLEVIVRSGKDVFATANEHGRAIHSAGASTSFFLVYDLVGLFLRRY